MSKQISPLRLSWTLVGIFAAAISIACSGSGSGCAALQPIPSGRYAGPKSDNAVNIRLSPHGINFLNQRWTALLDTFAPGQKLDIPLSCMIQSGVAIADQGGATCTTEACGQMDGKCDAKDQPKVISVQITGFQLLPVAPDSIQGTITASVKTGKIFVSTTDRTHAACAWLSAVKCNVQFDTTFDDANHDTNRIVASIKFTIDTKWDKLLSFSVSSLSGTQVCGSGAPARPQCLDPDDVRLEDENFCGNWCTVGNIDFVKTFILQQLSPTLQTQINNAIKAQSCEACGTGKPACPQLPNAASTCQNNVCVDNVTGKCVPRFLGVEGRLAPGMLLSGFGVPLDSELDISVAAGSSVSVDQGINIGTRAGALAVKAAACVPALPVPQLGAVTIPNFDAEAPIDPNTNTPTPYHVGLGISKQFLDLSMYHAHQSGALCIGMSSATTGLLNTGLFKTFLPSLGKLTTRDGLDAPMMVVLKPAQVPAITVGEGTFDPVTKKPIKPLLKLDLPDLTVDFYAMLDDRFVRLFSLTADISIPLSVIFEGCSSVTPALGDLKQLITNIRTANSEILAEDPKVLADLIPAVIGLAEPAVAGALKPFALPALGNFKLKVDATKGVTNISGTEAYEHLGIYATLMSATASCATASPKTIAYVKRSAIPQASEMKLTGKPLPWPIAFVQVGVEGGEGTAEYAYRIDGGLWTTFLAPNADGELEVSHPAFLLQGRHLIEVRSRFAEDPHGISAPVQLEFTVDWEAPSVTLNANAEKGTLEVVAHDAVTPKEELLFAYALGTEQHSEFGPARVIDLAGVEAQGGVTVLVQDAAGNVGTAAWKVPTTALRPEGAQAIRGDESVENAGCSATGSALGLWALAVAGAGALWRKRRARSQ